MLHVNQAGYPPASRKRAFSVHPLPSRFALRDAADGRIVLEGPVTAVPWGHGTVWMADFSDWSAAGQFLVTAGGSQSVPFPIRDDPYLDVYRTALRSYYLLRCGGTVEDPGSGIVRPACHLQAATPYEGGPARTVSGGWHDAGDYGRYMPTAAVTVGLLLLLADLEPAMMAAYDEQVPAGQGFHAELTWELDWMRTQQDDDGGVRHKLTSRRFCGMVAPEDDPEPQVLFPVHSGSTAQFAAAMAQAARLLPDPERRARCGQAALRAWEWLEQHDPVLDIPVADTGAYLSPGDADKRLWAAAALLALTGEERWSRWLDQHWADGRWTVPCGWAETSQLALLTLAAAPTVPDPWRERAHSALAAAVAQDADLTATTPWEVALAPDEYRWASTKVALTRAVVALVLNRLTGSADPRVVSRAQAQVDWVLGTNPLGVSLVSGIGAHAVRHLHHRYTVATGRIVPGLLSGGPNDRASDGVAPAGLGALSWVDDERAYSVNENAIDYNAPLVVATALLSAHCRRSPA
jgi:endoglucanase